MPAPSLVTLGFTTFRPETVPFAARAMAGHDMVVLEEPYTPGFEAMLANEMDLDDYLMLTEFAFPAYARAQCQALRALHAQGTAICQIHPWMDELAGIHEFFAAGHGPSDLPGQGPARAVYEREKAWTRALIAFYRTSGTPCFQDLTQAVTAFARADALKIRDMDLARARAMATEPGPGLVYVECGSIHQTMVPLMMRALGHGRVRVTHLMEAVCRPRCGVRRLLPPGDVLTFRHLMGAPADARRESLLAARALVYNKLILKEEMTALAGEFPHLDNEAAVIGFVSTLSYVDCQALWPRIRSLPTHKARELARLASH